MPLRPSIRSFVDQLAGTTPGPNSFNPFDDAYEDNALRRLNLELYLLDMAERKPKVLLLGEAPGYRGMRMTGIPFTDRSILTRGTDGFGLFGPDQGYTVPADYPSVTNEPTAKVMWQTLGELNFLPLLWSAYPLHPHRPDNPLSNRTPLGSEVTAGRLHWQALTQLFPIESVIALGNVAHRSITLSGAAAAKVRHPAHGGNVKFKQGLTELLAAGIND